jgi:hypothetical protein
LAWQLLARSADRRIRSLYDPDTFDPLPIKHALGRIANRRNAAKASSAKKKHSSAA